MGWAKQGFETFFEAENLMPAQVADAARGEGEEADQRQSVTDGQGCAPAMTAADIAEMSND